MTSAWSVHGIMEREETDTQPEGHAGLQGQNSRDGDAVGIVCERTSTSETKTHRRRDRADLVATEAKHK